MKKKPNEITQGEWNEINRLEYSEKLKRWRELELEFDSYFTVPEEDSYFPHKILATIVPDSVDKFELYYDYKVKDYKRQFPFQCDIEIKKKRLDEQLDNTPDPKGCIEFEINEVRNLVDRKTKASDFYFLRGYESCLRGLPLTFNRIDNTGEYWRILHGNTTCLFYSYLQNISTSNVLQERRKFHWSGSKSELSELIYSLSKMNVVKYRGTNDDVTLKDLQKVIEELFDFEISNVNDLIRSLTRSFKRKDNPKDYFTYKLFEQVKNYGIRS